MELTEYPLLHEVDLMLTLLKVATEGPASIEDAAERLKRNLESVGLSSAGVRMRNSRHISPARETVFSRRSC